MAKRKLEAERAAPTYRKEYCSFRDVFILVGSPEYVPVLCLHVPGGFYHALQEGHDEIVRVVQGLHAIHRWLLPVTKIKFYWEHACTHAHGNVFSVQGESALL